MTTVFLTLVAIAVSTAAAAHLAFHDPKRRRAFSEPPREGSPHRAGAWTLVYLPGLVLLVFDQWAAFMMWIGGAPLVSWVLVAQSPKFYRMAAIKLRSIGELRNRIQPRAWLAGASRQGLFPAGAGWGSRLRFASDAGSAQRVAELEMRVAELERLLDEAAPGESDARLQCLGTHRSDVRVDG